MAGSLSTAERTAFLRDGLLFPLRVLDAGDAERCRAACNDLETSLGGKPRTVEVRQMHLHFRWAYELATSPRILDAVESLLGPNLMIWATELFAKHPRDASVSIGWHRDRPYVGFAGSNVLATAWVALSASQAANGCMCAVPQSCEKPGSDSPEGQTIVQVALRPGEMSLHSPDVLHGSSANQSGEKRVGFAIRFVAPEARVTGDAPTMMLARGHVASNAWKLAAPPSADDEAAALSGMKASAVQHFDAVLSNLRRAKSCHQRT